MATRLTEGSPLALIVRFALPMMLGNMFQQLYSMTDMVIVGRTLGVDALAGIGLTGPLGFLFMGLVIGAAQGFSILCAQFYGAKKASMLRRAFAASLVLGALLSILFALASLLVPSLLHLTDAPKAAFDAANDYLTVTLFTGAGLVFYNILQSSITALGDSRTPLYFLILTCILNIGLDFLFILGFGLGVKGAAYATSLSLALSAVLCLWYLLRRIPELCPRRDDWRHLSFVLFWQHIRLGVPMGFHGCMISLGYIVLQTALNSLGPNAIAGCTAAARVDAFAVMPLISIGRAMSAFVGQNIGADRTDRVRQGVLQGAYVAIGYAWVAAAFCIFLGGPLISIFVGAEEEEVIFFGTRLLKLQAGLYWLLGLIFVLRNSIQGLGKSIVPTLSGIIELVLRAGAALFLVDVLGFDGICIASPLAWIGACLLLLPSYLIWRKEALRMESKKLP